MKIRVLLVDDEEDFAEALAQRLELRGFDVVAVFTGQAALDRLKKKDFDVVILDVLMPGRDGIDVLREMKQLKPLVEVILLTGHAAVQSAIEGMKLGAFDYLIKPTGATELVEKIEKAYARKSEHDERIRMAEIDSIMKRRGW